MSGLSSDKCVPCRVGAPKLTDDYIPGFLDQVDSEWKLERDPDKIVRNFSFDDFESAISFVNKVAEIAETQGHHPNIYIHDYNNVKIELWTHKIDGLHKNDFILASKIDELV